MNPADWSVVDPEPDPIPDRPVWPRATLLVLAGLVGAIVLLIIAAVLAAPSEARDDQHPLAGSRTPALRGAPHEREARPDRASEPRPQLAMTAAPPLAPTLDPRVGREGAEPAARTISGTATWYCGNGSPCTRGYGPSDLVAAIDTDLGFAKGDRVTVRYACGQDCRRSVTVEIVDTCACAGDRLIDLTTSAFQRLAPLGLGVIPVSLTLAGPSPTLPATDTP